jgi:hypothetical protein
MLKKKMTVARGKIIVINSLSSRWTFLVIIYLFKLIKSKLSFAAN